MSGHGGARFRAVEPGVALAGPTGETEIQICGRNVRGIPCTVKVLGPLDRHPTFAAHPVRASTIGWASTGLPSPSHPHSSISKPEYCRFPAPRQDRIPRGSLDRSKLSRDRSSESRPGAAAVSEATAPPDRSDQTSTLVGSMSARYRPVWLSGTCATCSGVPSATTVPPRCPPSGPRSTSQSATLMTSR